jgi:hypothetical protein
MNWCCIDQLICAFYTKGSLMKCGAASHILCQVISHQMQVSIACFSTFQIGMECETTSLAMLGIVCPFEKISLCGS